MMPVRKWVAGRRRAPDAGLPNPLLLRQKDPLAALEAVRSELSAIHHSRMWKLWSVYSGLKKAVGLGAKGASVEVPRKDK